METLPPCTRCGLCCIVVCCGLGEEADDGICKELVVHEDLTTSCRIAETLPFIGGGCSPRITKGVYEIHMKFYNITATKKHILENRKESL